MNAPIEQPRLKGIARSETPLRIVIVGHVDHGKSTLVGRLFHDTGSLPDGKLEQLKAICDKRGVPFEWAFLMDALKAERDQNVTIDTSQIWFHSEERPYVIIDAPGHKEFLKNMVTGAASASAALLLIAADEGVREQSKRHGYLLSLLGVSQVAVVVNKMDRVDYDEGRFREIEREYRAFLQQIGVTPQLFVPISAREGDNVATRSSHMPWYDGATVLEALDGFSYPTRAKDLPLRFPVQDIYRFDHRRILAGRIEAGTLQVGDRLVFHPGGKASRVASLEAFSADAKASASAGESVGVTLEEQIFVERGHVATLESTPPKVGARLRARVFWMGQRPLQPGRPLKLKLATQEVAARVERIERVIDASTLEERTAAEGASLDVGSGATEDGGGPTSGSARVGEGAALEQIVKDDVAELVLEMRAPLAFDRADDVVATGRFVLVDGYDLAGGGVILGDLFGAEARQGRVGWRERAAKNGHLPALVVLSGAVVEERRALAQELERALFERGLSVFAVDGNATFTPSLVETARALAAAGVIALVEASQTHGDAPLDVTLEDGVPSLRFDASERDAKQVADDVQAAVRLQKNGGRHGR